MSRATVAANFDLVWVAEKEERKRKKRRKKEEKKRKKGDFPIGLVIQRYSSLSVFWVRPGQFSRPFIVSFMRMSHPSRKKQVQNCTEWTISPHYVVDSGEHIGPELKLRNYQGSHQNITNTVLVQQMNHRMTKISIYHSKLNFKKSLILGHTSVRMGIRAPSVAHSLQTR